MTENDQASPSERAETDSSVEMSRSLPGVQRLRERRGAEQATFNDVADHFAEYARRHPHAATELDRIAEFLADAELRAHAHPTDRASTVSSE